MKKLLSVLLVAAMVLSIGAVAMAEDKPIVKLTWAMGTGADAPIDNAKVLDALNEMSRELIGVEMDIKYFTNDQVINSILTGEVYDIYFTCGWYNNTNQRVSEGIFADVSKEIEKYPGLYNAYPETVWDLAKDAEGRIYAIPNKKDYAMMNFITYPAERAAALGFEIPDVIEKWDDFTPFLEAWKATLAEGEYPVNIGGAPAGMESDFDFVERDCLIGCIFGTTKVVTVFEDPRIMERYRTMAKWFDAGLINPDAATLNETAIDTKKERINFVQAWTGYDGYTVSNGYITNLANYFGPNLSVDGIQGAMNAFSVTLEDDPVKMDAALKYFELIHTNKLFADTLRYGVKGEHWDYVTAEQNPDCAGCVLRTEAGNKGYNPWAFAQPAYFFTSIPVSQKQIDGIDPKPNVDQFDQYYADVADHAKVSAMGGFKFNTEKWINNIAEIKVVKDEFYKDFATGTRSIDEVYDAFMEKMNAAGLQDIIADAQAQLDAYLAANAK